MKTLSGRLREMAKRLRPEHEAEINTLREAAGLLERMDGIAPKKITVLQFDCITSYEYLCGDCGNHIGPFDWFCRNCGRAVKWDG